jgi:hypothetical protein
MLEWEEEGQKPSTTSHRLEKRKQAKLVLPQSHLRSLVALVNRDAADKP